VEPISDWPFAGGVGVACFISIMRTDEANTGVGEKFAIVRTRTMTNIIVITIPKPETLFIVVIVT